MKAGYMGRSQRLYKKAKELIPGGTQLLSKRPEMFLPDFWPAYYSKAKGCQVWDLDGNEYTDASYMALGACILGYADKDVNKAVAQVIREASVTTLNPPEEVELARVLIKLHPWADMARFARTGGEAMAIAVRIARAATGRDIILFCGYHGWHDWYLAANLSSDKALDGHLLPGLSPKGVPRDLKGTAYPFRYNDTGGFLRLARRHKKRIAAVVMEPIRNFSPQVDFIKTVMRTVQELRAVLVIDEITAGFRLNLGGAHLLFGLNPDIAVFAKGMSNGYPMAAVIGRKKIMQAAQDTFISSSYWTERIGPQAALATIKKLRQRNVAHHLKKIGKEVQEGWKELALKHKIQIKVSGIYPLSHFAFVDKHPLVLKTLFTQLMLKRGFLATTAFFASYAHKSNHIKKYLAAVDETFGLIAKAIKSGKAERHLEGSVCHSGFKRLI